MRFPVVTFASKKVQKFSSDKKILMLLLSVLFHLQNRVSVFCHVFLNFSHEGFSLHYVPKINLIS